MGCLLLSHHGSISFSSRDDSLYITHRTRPSPGSPCGCIYRRSDGGGSPVALSLSFTALRLHSFFFSLCLHLHFLPGLGTLNVWVVVFVLSVASQPITTCISQISIICSVDSLLAEFCVCFTVARFFILCGPHSSGLSSGMIVSSLSCLCAFAVSQLILASFSPAF